ncbi:unnamed protein product, partial [Iphiclides podalirius]
MLQHGAVAKGQAREPNCDGGSGGTARGRKRSLTLRPQRPTRPRALCKWKISLLANLSGPNRPSQSCVTTCTEEKFSTLRAKPSRSSHMAAYVIGAANWAPPPPPRRPAAPPTPPALVVSAAWLHHNTPESYAPRAMPKAPLTRSSHAHTPPPTSVRFISRLQLGNS